MEEMLDLKQLINSKLINIDGPLCHAAENAWKAQVLCVLYPLSTDNVLSK